MLVQHCPAIQSITTSVIFQPPETNVRNAIAISHIRRRINYV